MRRPLIRADFKPVFVYIELNSQTAFSLSFLCRPPSPPPHTACSAFCRRRKRTPGQGTHHSGVYGRRREQVGYGCGGLRWPEAIADGFDRGTRTPGPLIESLH